MTDIVLEYLLGQPRFSWGSVNPVNAGDCRKQYIESLCAADSLDYGQLLAFVRS